jgi:hypothetical protein
VRLGRRELLKLAAAAALARPWAARVASAAPAAAGAGAAGRFLSARELALLDEIAEILIPSDEHSPGARAAGVAAFLDSQLAMQDPSIPDCAEDRAQARQHLANMDELSRTLHGKGLLEVTPEQRVAVVAKAAEGEQDPGTPAEKAFVLIKQQVAFAYYTSEIGVLQEIGYKGNTILAEFVGELAS